MNACSGNRTFRILVHACLFIFFVAGTVTVFRLILHYPVRKEHVPRKFGATYMTMDNQYFEILNSAIQEIVESNGDILITRDPAQSQTKQNTQIMDMLDMGIDLVFLNPVDWKAVTPALIACREKNVPVINVDTNVFCSDCVASIVISDNYDAGVQIGKDIIAKRKAARIVVLNHNGINSTDLRIRGFMDTIEKSSLDYRIVYKGITTSTLVSSMAVMQKFLDRGIGFDVVIGGNDPTALGALAAMQKKHIETGIYCYME